MLSTNWSIVADEVHDDRRMDRTVTALLCVEALAAHAAGGEIGHLLRIEYRNDEVAFEFTAICDVLGGGKGDGDCGGIVVGARGGDGAVVVGTHQQGREPRVVAADWTLAARRSVAP